MEAKIVYLFPPEQWRYWRESKIVADSKAKGFDRAQHHLAGPHTATMAYSIDDAGQTARVWWVFPECSFLDGVDPPREMQTTPFAFVHPAKIKPNEPSPDWLPMRDANRLHSRLGKRPERLMRRWAEWEYVHKPRIVPAKTCWQRLLTWLKTFRGKK